MSETTRLPSPPRVPSDWLMLLTYVAPASNRIQQNRIAASAALELGIDIECATSAEEL